MAFILLVEELQMLRIVKTGDQTKLMPLSIKQTEMLMAYRHDVARRNYEDMIDEDLLRRKREHYRPPTAPNSASSSPTI